MIKNTKYTPGPWTSHENAILDSAGTLLGEFKLAVNATLAGCAPEMLDLLAKIGVQLMQGKPIDPFRDAEILTAIGKIAGRVERIG